MSKSGHSCPCQNCSWWPPPPQIKDWERISAESFLMSSRRLNQSRDWTHLNLNFTVFFSSLSPEDLFNSGKTVGLWWAVEMKDFCTMFFPAILHPTTGKNQRETVDNINYTTLQILLTSKLFLQVAQLEGRPVSRILHFLVGIWNETNKLIMYNTNTNTEPGK